MTAGRSGVVRFALAIIAWLVVAAFMTPIVWMTVNSFRPSHEIVVATSGFSPALFIPSALTLDNYAGLFATGFTPALVNSLVVVAAVVVGGLTVCALASFALSVLRFPGRDVIFTIVVISFIVPTDAVAFALLRLARGWGLAETYIGLILPVMVDGIVIFLLRQFFLGIPRDYLDAARVDGASWWAVFSRVYLPLSRPALIAGALVLFLGQWTAYLWPLLIVNDPKLTLAPIALVQAFRGMGVLVNYGVMLAGATILTLVPAAVLLPLQRYFVQSVSGTGLKG